MTRLQALCANVGQDVRRLLADESGATAIEYAIIAVGVSVVIVAAMTSVGSSVKGSFTKVSGGFN